MRKARATAPYSFWFGYGAVEGAAGDIVDGDLAVHVLADVELPFEDITEDSSTPKKPRTRKPTQD